MTLVRIDGLSLTFGDQIILHDAEFSIEPGERICLIGRNGAGKTTTLKLIIGSLEPDRGDIVTVAPGYARNFLYPRNLAMPATAANTRQIEEMRAAGARESARLTDDASKLAETMDGVIVRTVVRAGDSGQLFGSVGARDIAALLTEKGFPIDRHKVVLGSPLKETGDHDVRNHLYRDVNVKIKLTGHRTENRAFKIAFDYDRLMKVHKPKEVIDLDQPVPVADGR